MKLTAEHVRIAGVIRLVTGMRWDEAHRAADALLSQFEMTERREPIPIRWDAPATGGRPVLTIVPKEVQV